MKLIRSMQQAIILLVLSSCQFIQGTYDCVPSIHNTQALTQMLLKNVDDVTLWAKTINDFLKKQTESILNRTPEERSFANTIRAYDEIGAALCVFWGNMLLVQHLYPSPAMREASQKAIEQVRACAIDMLLNNRALYEAVKAYAEGNGKKTMLSTEQRTYVLALLHDFESSGLNLPEDQLARINELHKKIGDLTSLFDRNIHTTTATIACTLEDLAGLDAAFINSLDHNAQGLYIVRVDEPTYETLLPRCAISKTRERFWRAFFSRAYPENETVLGDIIAARDELAHLLGDQSYAHLDLKRQMARSPERVEAFFIPMAQRVQKKYEAEMAALKAELPITIKLDDKGCFKPWDLKYVVDQYKQKHLAVDEEKIAEYFPVQSTIEGMFSVFGQFLGLEFRQEKLEWQWHEDVLCVGVYTPKNECIGHLLFDLFPRNAKYSHACSFPVVPALKTSIGEIRLPVSAVVANFPKPTPGRPALLKLDDVSTLFHEFGHAMHALLGATDMEAWSGTNVARDFVEVPSQLFESWLSDETVLKYMSKHYITGQPLDDATIKQLVLLRQFDSGSYVVGQMGYARFALACFGAGAKKDLCELARECIAKPLSMAVTWDPGTHFECSFTHLAGYGACYYTYLWSQVCALDFFYAIKRAGLLKKEVGNWLIFNVLSKGGSIGAEELIREALGRDMTPDAFYEEFGL